MAKKSKTQDERKGEKILAKLQEQAKKAAKRTWTNWSNHTQN